MHDEILFTPISGLQKILCFVCVCLPSLTQRNLSVTKATLTIDGWMEAPSECVWSVYAVARGRLLLFILMNLPEGKCDQHVTV